MDATRARISALQIEWQENKSDLAPQRAFQILDEVLGIIEAEPEQWAGEADVFVELIETHSEALRPLFARMIAAGLDYPPFIWSGASAIESAPLIRAIDESRVDLGRTLPTLAWIGDPAAVEAFARWKREPPPGDDDLFISAAEYTREAAWYLDENDRKRELFVRHCFAIELDEEGANAPLFGDGLPPCSWCASPLSELLRIDLTAPAMNWIGWPGSVLRVPMCPRCGYFEMGFARMKPGEPFEWWFHSNAKLDLAALVAKDEFVLQPDNKLGGPVPQHVGAPRASLWSRGFDDFAALPKLGGYPLWIWGDWSYPPCPDCAHPMRFLAQVSDGGGGLFYILDCADCQTTATHYQIT